MSFPLIPLEKKLRIASIDVGKRNFALYVEDVPLQRYVALRTLSPKSSETGRKTDLKSKLRRIYRLGRTVLLEAKDICSEDVDNGVESYDNGSRLNLFAYLDERRDVLDDADVVLVEKQYFAQLSFGKKSAKRSGSEANVVAIKIAEDVVSWFLIRYGETKEVIMYPSQFKTVMLGAPKGLNGRGRKKWSVEKATRIMSHRKDEIGLAALESRRKKDDMSDVVIQCLSFLLKELALIQPSGALWRPVETDRPSKKSTMKRSAVNAVSRKKSSKQPTGKRPTKSRSIKKKPAKR